MALPDDVRAHCAGIAERSRSVRIEEGAIAAYAESLQPPALVPAADPRLSLQLNAINFGSGWFPTLRKRDGMSGFRTVEAGLRAHGPFADEELAAMDAPTIARILGQDPEHELMELYTRALRELAGVEVTATDAVAIAEQLAALPTWHDPGFWKRAQIAAAELAETATERLTMFADNLVPHVLRLDGILSFDDALVARIDREELLAHGSPEEVEIRACAVHAVELLAKVTGASAARLDHLLWQRGAQPRYKARPRHRARCTAY
jgi:hypothetical protein